MSIVSISGSPAQRSRSTWLLQLAQSRLAEGEDDARFIAVRELPAGALLAADVDAPAIRAAIEAVRRAELVIVATPIYKAAHSGLLKAFLDLLPPVATRRTTRRSPDSNARSNRSPRDVAPDPRRALRAARTDRLLP